MTRERRVAVVGGGITGLTTAYRLSRHRGVRVTLLEADARLGGKIRTEDFAGRPLDMGAEALLAREPDALALCRELGIADGMVASATDQAYVWVRRLHPMPRGMLVGAPGGAGALVRSGVLSPLGLARLTWDLVVPARVPRQDVAIGDVVRRRLGRQALERLVDPLLGGIHAGSCDDLSVRATAPQIEVALRTRRSLVRGLRVAAGAHGDAATPMFRTHRGGLGALVAALAQRLDRVDVRLGAAVDRIDASADREYRVGLRDGTSLSADQVVLAAPAYAAAAMLDRLSPEAAAELRDVAYASVCTVALAFPPGAVALPEPGSGFLVARTERRTITACTFSTAKWPHLAGDGTVLKCSVGYAASMDAVELPDDELVRRVRADLQAALGIADAPVATRVRRFDRAIPQYRVGHIDRVARAQAALSAFPGIQLAGAAYRGMGVAACIRDGTAAAARCLEAPLSR